MTAVCCGVPELWFLQAYVPRSWISCTKHTQEFPNEESSTTICVDRAGCWHREEGEDLQCMPVCQKQATTSSTSPLGMATAAMGQSLRRLFLGKMFLTLINVHSKLLDVHMVTSATSLVTTDNLRSTSATLGLPEVLVIDNGTTFTSADFERFCTRNGIHHLCSTL